MIYRGGVLVNLSAFFVYQSRSDIPLQLSALPFDMIWLLAVVAGSSRCSVVLAKPRRLVMIRRLRFGTATLTSILPMLVVVVIVCIGISSAFAFLIGTFHHCAFEPKWS